MPGILSHPWLADQDVKAENFLTRDEMEKLPLQEGIDINNLFEDNPNCRTGLTSVDFTDITVDSATMSINEGAIKILSKLGF